MEAEVEVRMVVEVRVTMEAVAEATEAEDVVVS